MSEWVMLVPSIVFTKIKTDFSQVIKDKYKMTNDNFSTIDSNNSKAVYPFVYVHLLPAIETGFDLEQTSINAGVFTFQIDVYDNRTQSRSREIMGEVMRIMKTMSFQITSMPEFSSSNGVYRNTMRAKRTIDSKDVL